MKKFKIYNASLGRFQTAVNAKPVRFHSPEWLRAYRFFTHRPIEKSRSKTFTLSEVTTGTAVSRNNASRYDAKASGWRTIVGAGEQRVKDAIAERLREQSLVVGWKFVATRENDNALLYRYRKPTDSGDYWNASAAEWRASAPCPIIYCLNAGWKKLTLKEARSLKPEAFQ